MFKLSYANVISTIALFLAVAGGTAVAAGLAADSVNSRTVKDNKLKSVDLKDDKAVSGIDVIDDSLAGADVDESSLGQVPDAAQLQGRGAASFVASSIYKSESAIGPGNALGDGTHVIDHGCDPGDVLLSGGPANIRNTSTLLESFPSPGGTNSWTARINKNGQVDNFSVVVLCADQ